MGVEQVELIMAVEEKFEFEIPDNDAERLTTVGDLFAYILGRLGHVPSPRCPSGALFYRTRRVLMDLHGAPRQSIRPSTRLEALLPRDRRRMDWQVLQRVTGWALPELQHPLWMRNSLIGARWALFLACALLLFRLPLDLTILCSVLGSFLLWAAARAAEPFAVQIPAHCATVGGAVRICLPSQKSAWFGSLRTWTVVEVWTALREVIVEQFQVRPEEVTPEASFIDDLGFG